MKISVIGSGGICGTVGTLWAKAGHEVLFSSRNPEKLSALVAAAGNSARAGMIAEAASFADRRLCSRRYCWRSRKRADVGQY